MKQIEYNLLEERWVRVRGQDYTVQEVSLPDALLHAHEYRDLAGELKRTMRQLKGEVEL